MSLITILEMSLGPLITINVANLPMKVVAAQLADTKSEVTKESASVQLFIPLARAVPNWLWQLIAWTLFVAGYFMKTAISFETSFIVSTWYVVLENPPYWVSLMMYLLLTLQISHQTLKTCQADFQAFLDLGPGGTPSTWNGFKRITLNAWFGKINVLKPPKHNMGAGYLESLPIRQGVRPFVGGIAPQRQLDQRNTPEVFDYLLTWLDHFAAENSTHLHKDMSFLEKKTEAIFSRCDCVNDPLFRVFGSEICHPHHVDGSLHVMLHPEDIRTVIEASWGERQPLARGDGWWTWWHFVTEGRPPVPEHLCFTYAPRTYEEVCIVMKIVEAGARYVANSENGCDGHSSCSKHSPRPAKVSTVSLS